MDSELLEEFEVTVWIHYGSVPSPFPFAVLVDIAELEKGIVR